MLSLLWSRPGMRVYCGDPSGVCLGGDARMRGFPHSDDPEETMKGSWGLGLPRVGGALWYGSRWKGILRAVKPRGEGLKPSPMKLEPQVLIHYALLVLRDPRVAIYA